MMTRHMNGTIKECISKQIRVSSAVRFILIVVLIATVAEIFVFNYRHWESLTFSPIVGYEQTESIIENGNLTVELNSIDAEVKNIRINPFAHGKTAEAPEVLEVQIGATDLANSEYLILPKTEVVYRVPESEYVRLHLVGPSKTLKVVFFGITSGDFDERASIELNVERPLYIRPWRLVMFMLVGCLFVLFRHKSKIYNYELCLKVRWQLALTVCIICINVGVVLVVGMVFSGRIRTNGENVTSSQYAYLAESLIKGHVWLNADPPSALEDIDNPYDPDARSKALQEAGQSYTLDYAYYNGRYYSYFGVIPAVLFYVPWQLIFGSPLPTALLSIALSCAFVPAAFWLLYEVIRRHIPSVSIGLYLLLASVLVMVSGVLGLVQYPIIYSVPILSALLFASAGLACWFHAAAWQGGNPKRGWLVAGGLLVALVMGCRPQLAMIVLLAFPIFWQHIKAKLFFSRRGLINTLCVMAPFVAIGVPLMWYNAARFGNPFDFGATYNLTGFDMTHRGFDGERFILGFWEYLFQPVSIGASFPYIATVAPHFALVHDFQGLVVNEPLVGGFFALNPLGLFIMAMGRARNKLNSYGLLGIAIACFACAMAMIALDIQMVGINLRYFADFSLLLMLSTLLVVLAVLQSEKNARIRRVILCSVILLALFCVAMNLLVLLANGRYNALVATNPYRFYMLKYQLFSVLSIR